MYTMICTRLDITFAISVIYRYQLDLDESHWITVKHILKYLRRTKDMLLIYGDNDIHIDGYTDLDFQLDNGDCKLMSNFVSLLNGSVVSCKSSKQEITVDSTTKIKYVATYDDVEEVVWI